MPIVDGVVEGDVVPAVHNGENVAIKGKFFDDLANGIVDLNDDMHATDESVAALQGEVAGKQDALTTSDDLSIGSDNELSLTDMAKKRLFIDIWNTACGSYGSYNATTGFFELNGLTDITYEEALKIDSYGMPTGNIDGKYAIPLGPRTFYPYLKLNIATTANEAFAHNSNVVALSGLTFRVGSYSTNMFINCKRLRYIGIKIDAINSSLGKNIFKACKSLQTLNIERLGGDLSLSDSPLITLESLTNIIAQATNTNTITITVHADVYAKLTGDTTNAAAAALSAEELAQWQQLMTDATAKNISFIEATT